MQLTLMLWTHCCCVGVAVRNVVLILTLPHCRSGDWVDPLVPVVRVDGPSNDEWHAVKTVFDQKRRVFTALVFPIRTGTFEYTGARVVAVLPLRSCSVPITCVCTCCSPGYLPAELRLPNNALGWQFPGKCSSYRVSAPATTVCAVFASFSRPAVATRFAVAAPRLVLRWCAAGA